MDGGPLRCWVMVGTPARVLHAWAVADRCARRCRRAGRSATITRGGASAASRRCGGSSPGYQERGLPLRRRPSGHRPLRRPPGVHRRPGAVSRSCRRWPRSCGATGSGWCRSSTRRSRPSRATPCTTAGSPRTRSCGTRRGGSCEGVVWPGEAVYPGLHATRAVRAWWGGLYEERLGAGVRGVLARHERADVLHRVRGVRRCRVRPGTRWRAAAATTARRTTCTRCAWPGPATRGCANWRRRSGRSCSPGPGGPACSATAAPGPGTWPRAGRGCGRRCRWCMGLGLCGVPYSGPDVGGFDGQPVARAVSAVVPARRVPAAVPHARESAGGAQGALGVRCRGAGARARGARRTPAAAAVLHDAGASGAAHGGALRAARCGGARPRTGRCGTARTPSCWATACWWRRCSTRARTGGRCSCRAGAGTTRRRSRRTRGRDRCWSTPRCRGSRCSRARAPSCRCGATTAVWSWRCGRPPAGGAGADWSCRTRATGGTSRRSSATSPAGRADEVVVERDGRGRRERAVPTRCGCAGWDAALRLRRSGPRTRRVRPACAAGRRAPPACAGGASPPSRRWRRTAAGRSAGRSGRSPNSSRCPSGELMRVDEPYVAARRVDAGLLLELADDGVPPVLTVVDVAAGQGDASARGGDGSGDDDQGGALCVVHGLECDGDRQRVAVGHRAAGGAGAGPAGDALSVGRSAARTVGVGRGVGGWSAEFRTRGGLYPIIGRCLPGAVGRRCARDGGGTSGPRPPRRGPRPGPCAAAQSRAVAHF